MPYDVVGLGNFGTTVLICTKGGGWIASGTHPESLALAKLEFEQACIGKGTITPIGDQGVAYAGPDGLVLVGPGGTRMVTEKTFGYDDWKALGMESAIATYHEGYYLAFLDDKAIAIDPRSGEGFEYDDDAKALYLDIETDEVYIVVGTDIQEFRTVPESGVSSRTATWRSKSWRGRLRSPGAYQVFGDVDTLRILDPDPDI